MAARQAPFLWHWLCTALTMLQTPEERKSNVNKLRKQWYTWWYMYVDISAEFTPHCTLGLQLC